MKATTYHMLDPTAELAPERRTRRVPPAKLEDVTIGLLSISKERSSEFLEVGRVQLHDAAVGVGHQDVVVTVLLIADHVERAVACAELGDRRALDLRAGFQIADRDLHDRGAGVGRQHVILIVDGKRQEGAHGRVGFEAAM